MYVRVILAALGCSAFQGSIEIDVVLMISINGRSDVYMNIVHVVLISSNFARQGEQLYFETT